jgi:fatty acid desaturase
LQSHGRSRVLQVKPSEREDKTMLWTILVILLVLWALGFLVFHVAGGLIHLLLVIAVVVLVVRLIQGKRVL